MTDNQAEMVLAAFVASQRLRMGEFRVVVPSDVDQEQAAWVDAFLHWYVRQPGVVDEALENYLREHMKEQ